MREIPLTQGKVAIVDDEDFERLSQWKWYYKASNLTGYAARDVTVEGKRVRIKMHRIIMNPADDEEVDHIDGDGCNNQRHNLRVCTHQENCCNNRRATGEGATYRGVRYESGRWRAAISSGDSVKSLGSFLTEEDAARAFDSDAHQRYGEFAKLNFPDDEPLTNLEVEALRQKCRAKFTSSRYYGVRRVKDRDVWEAYITLNGRHKYIKRFKTEDEAALAYNDVARAHYGDEYPYLNIIMETSQ